MAIFKAPGVSSLDPLLASKLGAVQSGVVVSEVDGMGNGSEWSVTAGHYALVKQLLSLHSLWSC